MNASLTRCAGRPGLWRTRWARLLSFVVPIAAKCDDLQLDPSILPGIEQRHGAAARRRVEDWRQLVLEGRHLPEAEKLARVNDFVNRLVFTADLSQWKREDYWATPLETVSAGGGDCEDFALVKFFSLTAMGVDESRLRLTYVKAIRLNQSHMVVTYYTAPEAVPLVLDNLAPTIRPASERDDLIPVYSFNGTGLWLARQRGEGRPATQSERLHPWRDLLERMRQEVR